jgi:enamine deaminase RidA (YjgF/YER057c/UK114 family)
VPASLLEETQLAFQTVSDVIQNAISASESDSGWTRVYKVTTYFVDLRGHEQEVFDIMIPMLKKWCGEDHAPTWTLIGVAALANKDQRVEIEVSATCVAESAPAS